MIRPECDDDIETDSNSSMTPMIDVIFTLIAFMMLMINAPLLSMDLDLPDAKKTEIVVSTEAKSVAIAVLQEENQWKLGEGNTLSGDELKLRLNELKIENENGIKVVLTTDKTTYVQRMVDTISILNELEIEGSQIAINRSENN
ncbi:ExbD/TolR family protein [Vibrio sp. MA40-2]|uniref:ExbD/TolR family protein n=1 Tax=Vibrio sp. MA40-2 TaxID=3391828 RepID=UPI0039A433A2